jgi:hypothetical protein
MTDTRENSANVIRNVIRNWLRADQIKIPPLLPDTQFLDDRWVPIELPPPFPPRDPRTPRQFSPL